MTLAQVHTNQFGVNGMGRSFVMGAVIGFVLTALVTGGIALFAGAALGPALGIGAFAGFWGGPGFGGMLAVVWHIEHVDD